MQSAHPSRILNIAGATLSNGIMKVFNQSSWTFLVHYNKLAGPPSTPEPQVHNPPQRRTIPRHIAPNRLSFFDKRVEQHFNRHYDCSREFAQFAWSPGSWALVVGTTTGAHPEFFITSVQAVCLVNFLHVGFIIFDILGSFNSGSHRSIIQRCICSLPILPNSSSGVLSRNLFTPAKSSSSHFALRSRAFTADKAIIAFDKAMTLTTFCSLHRAFAPSIFASYRLSIFK
ncbi:hypothetical protein BDQ17DRAFT_1426713 [Cyathus striatus]|nr:hypothetical protein BDQ17DRAFT_1426713 [Cyathus striatus]